MKKVGFIFILLFSLVSMTVIDGCGEKKPDKPVKATCRLSLSKKQVKNGESFKMNLTSKNGTITKTKFSIDGQEISYNEEFTVEGFSLGIHKVMGVATFDNGNSCQKYAYLEVLPNEPPVQLTYELINTFDHDNMSYTQGLEFHNNLMYEGTGQYGFSYITNYSTLDMKKIQKVNMSEDVFGEGITIFKDKLYQLTYKQQMCYVYDVNTLKLLHTYGYTGEGWGLTHDDEYLIMSNGSNSLFYRDPETFDIVKTINVYTPNMRVDALNELEYVNKDGQAIIYANRYQLAEIVGIDPETGAVLEVVNMRGILDPKHVTSQVDVLNGIAYNASNEHYYVTGKFWPKMYEVKFVPPAN